MRGRGFKNDRNREDDPEHLVRLIGQVVTGGAVNRHLRCGGRWLIARMGLVVNEA